MEFVAWATFIEGLPLAINDPIADPIAGTSLCLCGNDGNRCTYDEANNQNEQLRNLRLHWRGTARLVIRRPDDPIAGTSLSLR